MQAPPLLIIEAGRADRNYWRDIWRYRELFYFFALRDILVRYRQTVIGVLWALLRPALTMAAFTLVFGKLAKLPSDGTPYPLFVLAGLLPWHFFANGFSEAGNSLIGNANMISKVYFPRLIVPTSAILVCLVDFLVAAALMAGLMIWYGLMPTLKILALPALILLVAATALGAGLWTAALNVKYRDFRYVVPFVVQFGLYISPVGFSSNLVPQDWRLIYALNPMTGIIDGIRWAILPNSGPLFLEGIYLSLGIASLLLLTGIYYFRKMEKGFADVI